MRASSCLGAYFARMIDFVQALHRSAAGAELTGSALAPDGGLRATTVLVDVRLVANMLELQRGRQLG